jgi:hypothetical protein
MFEYSPTLVGFSGFAVILTPKDHERRDQKFSNSRSEALVTNSGDFGMYKFKDGLLGYRHDMMVHGGHVV